MSDNFVQDEISKISQGESLMIVQEVWKKFALEIDREAWLKSRTHSSSEIASINKTRLHFCASMALL